MIIDRIPKASAVETAIENDDCLIAAISFDGKKAIVAPESEYPEHHIMLNAAGEKETDIEKYFRIRFDRTGAIWTFQCPLDYKGIENEQERIGQYEDDGYKVIANFLRTLGYTIRISMNRIIKGLRK